MSVMAPNSASDIRALVLTRLLRGVLHDVNNSLTAIGLSAELALRKQDQDAGRTALERAMTTAQAQRSQLDAAALVVSDPATAQNNDPIVFGALVSEIAALCSLICRHDIVVDDESDGVWVTGQAADLSILVAACLLDACLVTGPLNVRVAVDLQDDTHLQLLVQGDGIRSGAIFEAENPPRDGLNALSEEAGCQPLWHESGYLAGCRVALFQHGAVE